MNRKQPANSASGGRSGPPVLVITPQSLQLGRRLGPQPWLALQYLALRSCRTARGLTAALGVRGVASGIGVTKDTAARAVSALVAAELVSRDRVETAGGRWRPGYLLRLPDEIRLIDCPTHLDGTAERRSACPNGEYSSRPPRRAECPEGEYTPGRGAAVGLPPDPDAVRRVTGVQPALFEERPPPSPAAVSTPDPRIPGRSS